MSSVTDCPRCKGTGGVLFSADDEHPAGPGPCPDCCGTGVAGAVCDEADDLYCDDAFGVWAEGS